MKIKAGIVGATGYAGAELVRLLTAHPEAEISAISSVSFEGDKLSDVYPSYTFLNDMVCENQDAVVEKSDVIFAALPHGLSQELAAKCIDAGKKFPGIKGLGKVVVRSGVQSPDPILKIRPGREHQDGRGGARLADLAAYVKAVHLRHDHIQQDKVDIGVRPQQLDRAGAVFRLDKIVFVTQNIG